MPPPRENSELIGHDAAERRLFDAWASGRLPHAWLIGGPRGIGKATLAYRFARFLLKTGDATACLVPPTDLAVAPDDPVFRRVAAGSHADLLTVERGWDAKRERRRAEIVVDDVRGIGGFLRLTPAEGGWRVVVVDGADDMNPNAANAILKVLEEPPQRALLLLVSHAPGRLLATIRSRCCRLTLAPLGDDAVVQLLGRAFPDLPATDATTLARLADASAGRALALAEQNGLAVYRELTGLLNRLPALDGAALHGLGDKLAAAGADPLWQAARALLSGWLVRLVLSGAGGPAAGAALPDEAATTGRLIGHHRGTAAGLDRWVEVWEKTSRLFGQADSANLDRKQVFLDVFFVLQAAARSARPAA
jgi:DNA polymerase-3 subunit delta'